MNQVRIESEHSCTLTPQGEIEKLLYEQPRLGFAYSGNLYFHLMEFPRGGLVVPTHEHTYPHVYQQMEGRCEVTSGDGKTFVMKAGDLFDVPAGIAHKIVSLEPAKGQCIHVMRYADGKEVPFDAKLTGRERMEITRAM